LRCENIDGAAMFFPATLGRRLDRPNTPICLNSHDFAQEAPGSYRFLLIFALERSVSISSNFAQKSVREGTD
jgi:hypothetical protein